MAREMWQSSHWGTSRQPRSSTCPARGAERRGSAGLEAPFQIVVVGPRDLDGPRIGEPAPPPPRQSILNLPLAHFDAPDRDAGRAGVSECRRGKPIPSVRIPPRYTEYVLLERLLWNPPDWTPQIVLRTPQNSVESPGKQCCQPIKRWPVRRTRAISRPGPLVTLTAWRTGDGRFSCSHASGGLSPPGSCHLRPSHQ